MNPDTKITDSDRLRWLHAGGGRDAEGFEWGIFRVKWDAQGQPVEVWQTNSDFSDLDAEMLREAASQNTEVTERLPADGTDQPKGERR